MVDKYEINIKHTIFGAALNEEKSPYGMWVRSWDYEALWDMYENSKQIITNLGHENSKLLNRIDMYERTIAFLKDEIEEYKITITKAN